MIRKNVLLSLATLLATAAYIDADAVLGRSVAHARARSSPRSSPAIANCVTAARILRVSHQFSSGMTSLLMATATSTRA